MLIPTWSQEKRMQMVEVSLRKRAATTWIQGATMLDVYTGEWRRAEIVIYQERIAYVGEREPLCDEQTVVLPAEEFYVVPGYIEPHAHPFQLYNPLTLANYIVQRGTTFLVCDSLPLLFHGDESSLLRFMEEVNHHPLRLYWWVRFDSQSLDTKLETHFQTEVLTRLLQHPAVLQVGEFTAWPQLIFQGASHLQRRMELAHRLGKRVDGHIPGASRATLQAVAAAGVTACHEGIDADEVQARLEAGLYAELRHSSIRPDLPVILPPLLERGVLPNSRTMLTTDGSTPPALRHGFLDHLLRVAMEAGMPAVEAYRMATLYPATYFRLDSEVGGIAPGRVADLLFLSSPHEPTPVQVMVNGKLQHAETEARLQQQQLQFPWDSYLPPLQASAVEIAPAWFQIPANPTGLYPIIKLENAVITRLQEEPLPVKDSQVDLEGKSGYLLIAVLDKELRWITRGIIHGFAHQLHALASTYNSINEIVVLGSSPAAMARAVEQVLALGGGIVLVEGDEPIYQLPLPLAGLVSPMELEELIPRTEELVQLLQERGYTHADPFYSLFFFTTTHLPTIRLTAQGLYLVKEREVIQPSERL